MVQNTHDYESDIQTVIIPADGSPLDGFMPQPPTGCRPGCALIENLQTSQQKPSVPLRYEAFDLLYRLKTDPRYGLVQTEDEWLQLYAVINRLYGDIVDKLRNWPQLTEQDVRVCYLVHARMSNANLGALFNVDSRSITKSKQRIKKKMEIDGEWSLEEYLMKGK